MHQRVILSFIATVTAVQLVLAQIQIRDPGQAIDHEYTNRIREYTTELLAIFSFITRYSTSII